MVEFSLGRNIKAKADKLLVATKGSVIADYLNAEEQRLASSVKKQTVQDNVKVFDLGDYTIYTVVVKPKQSAFEWQLLGGQVWKHIKQKQEIKVALIGAKNTDFYDFALGLEMASYSFDKYFTKKPASYYPNLEKIVYTNSGLHNLDGYKDYAALANSIRYARDLINEPANALTPEIFAEDVKRMEYLGLKVEIMDEEKMKSHDFNLALAVAQGSANRPKIVVIKWQGNPSEHGFRFGLVGKGVTFDSGGISIKPSANMGDMKQDMAGAAAIAATMKTLALQKAKQNVVAVLGLVENMPSGSAYRPGDIVKSMSGQTVEVVNTDAEGRLVLADCLTYIQKSYQPQYVIDMATLTGAIVVALGATYAGLFSNHQNLARDLIAAGDECGERVWKMPMDKEYDKMMDSAVADMKNTGSRSAGSATAACFLNRFIEKNTRWAHIDIAGMDLSDGSKVLYPKGASAYGVKLLTKFITAKK